MFMRIFGRCSYCLPFNAFFRGPMEEGVKVDGLFNGYGNVFGHEVQEIEGEIFSGSPEPVFFADILEKHQSLCPWIECRRLGYRGVFQ